MGNRCSGVVRLHRCLPRSRLCSPLTVDRGVRVCRGKSSSSRPCLPGGAGEAVATASQGNKFLWSLPRPFGVCSWRQWRGQGRGDSPDPLFWSPWPATHLPTQVMLLLVLLLKDVVRLLGDVVDGRMDLHRFPLGGAFRRRRWRIQKPLQEFILFMTEVPMTRPNIVIYYMLL